MSGPAAFPDDVANELAPKLLQGHMPSLSRAITLLESRLPHHQHLAAQLLDAALPHSHKAFRLGVAGPPGVGKSSLLEALGLHAIHQGQRVAVLSIDPSSPRRGGSLLGDKTRMPQLSAHPQAFVRPSPGGRAQGGLNWRTREAALLCAAAGYDLVCIETVGSGQNDVELAQLTDALLLLVQPGGGDHLQGLKRGVMEMADLLVVTKADGAQQALAEAAANEFRHALGFMPPPPSGWAPLVLAASAHTGQGLAQLWQALLNYRHHMDQYQRLALHRQKQVANAFTQLLHEQLLEGLLQQATAGERVQHWKTQALHGRCSALSAALQAAGSPRGTL